MIFYAMAWTVAIWEFQQRFAEHFFEWAAPEIAWVLRQQEVERE